MPTANFESNTNSEIRRIVKVTALAIGVSSLLSFIDSSTYSDNEAYEALHARGFENPIITDRSSFPADILKNRDCPKFTDLVIRYKANAPDGSALEGKLCKFIGLEPTVIVEKK